MGRCKKNDELMMNGWMQEEGWIDDEWVDARRMMN